MVVGFQPRVGLVLKNHLWKCSRPISNLIPMYPSNGLNWVASHEGPLMLKGLGDLWSYIKRSCVHKVFHEFIHAHIHKQNIHSNIFRSFLSSTKILNATLEILSLNSLNKWLFILYWTLVKLISNDVVISMWCNSSLVCILTQEPSKSP